MYLFFVRGVLYRDGSYVDLWPEWLDLENLVYRPVLTRYLPDFFGNVMSVFGENKVLRKLARLDLLEKAAAVFGENRLLTPLASWLMIVLNFIGRVLESCLDWLIVMLRHTVLKERSVISADRIRADSLAARVEEVSKASEPIIGGFSYALMMTCAGVLVILGVLVFYIIT